MEQKVFTDLKFKGLNDSGKCTGQPWVDLFLLKCLCILRSPLCLLLVHNGLRDERHGSPLGDLVSVQYAAWTQGSWGPDSTG